MIQEIISFDLIILFTDAALISFLRKFLIDFLRVDNSKNVARRAYRSQPVRNRITLSFIKSYLKTNIAVCIRYQRLYITILYTLVPQYVIIVASNFILGMNSLYVVGFFEVVKLPLLLLVRMNLDSNKVSLYRKYKKCCVYYCLKEETVGGFIL